MRTRVDRHDRETFISELLKSVPTATRADALRLLRWGRTYGRLCEAECNGDYPYNPPGDWEATCSGCQATYHRTAEHGLMCPSCRAERIIRETCERMGGTWGAEREEVERRDPNWMWVTPHFQGDPRGYTVRLQIAGAPLDAYERPALAVPTS